MIYLEEWTERCQPINCCKSKECETNIQFITCPWIYNTFKHRRLWGIFKAVTCSINLILTQFLSFIFTLKAAFLINLCPLAVAIQLILLNSYSELWKKLTQFTIKQNDCKKKISSMSVKIKFTQICISAFR